MLAVPPYKVILNSIINSSDILEKEFPELIAITKEKEAYNWYFSNIKEEDLEELIKKIEQISLNEQIIELAEDEEEARLEEERRLQQKQAEDELEFEIKKIFENKHIIREIKEYCEDIEQLIYRLKNQVNFMTFYYLITNGKDINYNIYSKTFDWYMDLSQKYVKYKKIDIEYKDNSSEYFENQLNIIKKTYQILYSAWEVFRAEKKILENNFDNIMGKVSKELILKISKENIFGFRKEVE